MKKSHLQTIKETGFKTPDTYFDTFDDRLIKKLEGQKEMSSISDAGFKIPDNYFESFGDKLQTRLKAENSPKVIKFRSWRHSFYVSGIAAALVLMLTVFMKSKDDVSINQIETASIEDYLNNENLNVYDIASLLNEDELILDNFVSNTLSEESLENYLLNNASIEELINDK